MELSKENKDRLQKAAKTSIVAIAVGGVAVKIFHQEDGWGYAHVERANVWMGVIKENSQEKLAQITGILRNTISDVANGQEPDIVWDEHPSPDSTALLIEKYVRE